MSSPNLVISFDSVQHWASLFDDGPTNPLRSISVVPDPYTLAFMETGHGLVFIYQKFVINVPLEIWLNEVQPGL